MATEYFVDIDGDDSYNGLYSEWLDATNGPLASIEAAAEVILPGDIVSIRQGIYTANVSIVGLQATEEHPILFRNYADEQVVVTPGSWDWSTAFSVEQSAHIHLRGLRFENCEGSRHPVEIDRSADCVVKDCRFENTPYPPALAIDASTNITVSGTLFLNTGNASRNWDSHLTVGGSDAVCSNIVIENCEFIGSDGMGITDHAVEMMRADHSRVTGCTFCYFDQSTVLTFGIPSWYYTAGERLPHHLSAVSNRFENNLSRSFGFYMCHDSELCQNVFVSNRCEIVNFGGTDSFYNLVADNLFVDNFDLLSGNDAFIIMVQNSGPSNAIVGNEIFNTAIPETVSANTPEAIFVQNTSDLNIISNAIHDIRVKADVDLTEYDPDWFMSAEDGGYAAFGMHILGTDFEISNIVINANTVHDVATGISVGGACNVTMNSNTVYNCGTYGLRFKNGTRNSLMQGNTIYECGSLHGGCSGIGLGFSGTNNLILANVVHHCRQGTAAQIGTNWWSDGNGMIADMDSDGCLFVGNLSVYNEGCGLAITASENTRVFNNTFIGNGECAHNENKPGLGIYSKTSEGYPAWSNIVANNIFYNNVGRELSVQDILGQEIHHNLYMSNSLSAYTKPILWKDTTINYNDRFMTVEEWKIYSSANVPDNAVGALWNNPAFVNAASTNFRLTSNSPAIDSGINLAAQWPDLDGSSQPIDGDNNGTSTLDIGCYEFDPDFHLYITHIDAAASGNVTVTWPSRRFWTYTLQCVTNLNNAPAGWSDVSSVYLSGAATTLQITDTGIAPGSCRFYRVVAE